MCAMNGTDSERRVREQACVWAMRLGMQPLDARQQRQLDRWLAADARHGPALADAEMAWALAGECRDSAVFAQPVPRARSRSWRRPWRFTGWTRAWSMTGVAASLVLVLYIGLGGGAAVAPLLADYRNSVGQVRMLTLPDGSQVLLGSDSALDIQYGPNERLVTLVRGEAVFTPTSRNASEPRAFVVQAAGGRAIALGTRFVVQRENDDRARVGVLQHSVMVRLDRTPRQGIAQLTLPAGRSAIYSAEGGIVPVDTAPGRVADWADGYLVFDGQMLEDVLQRLGQFRPGFLVLMNRQAAERPVHALFHLDNLDGAIATLCTELRLKALHLPGMTVLY